MNFFRSHPQNKQAVFGVTTPVIAFISVFGALVLTAHEVHAEKRMKAGAKQDDVLVQSQKTDSRLLRAVALLSRDQRKEAYGLLETVFATSKSPIEQARVAAMLAYASNLELKAHKRHYYASYAIENHDQIAGIDERAQFDSLTRIAADGYFDDADLDSAEKYYAKLATSQDVNNVDYSEYKRGWIDLNKDQPSHAFSRWLERVKSKQSSRQDLREALIRDLGRAWAESKASDPKMLKSIEGLSLGVGELEKLVEGVVAGMRRIKEVDEQTRFRSVVQNASFVNMVFAKVLAQSIWLSAEPCSVLDWLEESIAIEKVPTKELSSALNHCFVHLKKKEPGQWRTSKTRERIISAAMRIHAVALERWMRAEFLREVGDWSRACQEFVLMGSEHLTAAKQALPLESLGGFVETCKNFVSAEADSKMQNARKQIALSYAELLSSMAQVGLLKQGSHVDAYTALSNEFSKIEEFVPALHKLVFSNAESLGQTKLAAVVLSHLSKEQYYGQMGRELLEKFAPRPIESDQGLDSAWIELVKAQVKNRIDGRDFKGAYAALQTHLPLSAETFMRPAVSDAWVMWILGLPEPLGELAADASRVMHLLLDSVVEDHENIASGRIEIQNLLLAASLKLKEVELVWAKFRKLSWSDKADSALVAQFYQTTFDLIASHKMNSAEVSNSAAGECLAVAGDVISEMSILKKQAQFNRTCLRAFSKVKPAFVLDIEQVAKFAQAKNAQRLALNSVLAKRIESRFQEINGQIKTLSSHPWCGQQTRRFAQEIIAENCTKFINELDALSEPKGLSEEDRATLQATVRSVIDLVKNWRDVVLKDTKADKKS